MERGENGRKHVIKNAGQNTFKTDEEDVLENAMKLEENMITIRRNGAKSLGKWRKPERMLGTNREDGVKMLENTMKVQENVITTRGNGAKTIGKSRRRGGNKKE